jgi:hypothetical protein
MSQPAEVRVRVLNALGGAELLPWSRLPSRGLSEHLRAQLTKPETRVLLFDDGELVERLRLRETMELTAAFVPALDPQQREAFIASLTSHPFATYVQARNVFETLAEASGLPTEVAGAAADDHAIALALAKHPEAPHYRWLSAAKRNNFDIARMVLRSTRSSIAGRCVRFMGPDLRACKTFMLEALQRDVNSYRFLDAALKADADVRDLVLRRLSHANACVWQDRDLMLALLRRQCVPLSRVGRALRADKAFVLQVVARCECGSCQFLHGANSLTSDRDVVRAVLAKRGYELAYAHASLRADRDIVMLAVRQCGNALQHAAPRLRADPGVVRAAVRANGYALIYASLQLRYDKKLALEAVAQNGGAFAILVDPLREDRQVALAALAQDGHLLGTVLAGFQHDRKVVLAAVARHGLALRYAHPVLHHDRAVVAAAIEQNGLALKYAPDFLREDEQLVLAAARNNGLALFYARAPLRHRADIVEIAAAHHPVCRHLALEPLLLPHGPMPPLRSSAKWELRHNRDIALCLMRDYPARDLPSCAEALRDDEELVRIAVARDAAAFGVVSARLRAHKPLVLDVVSRDGMQLRHAPALCSDWEVALAAVTQCASSYCYVGSPRSCIRFASFVVARDGLQLRHAPRRLRADLNLVALAVRQNAASYRFAASEALCDKGLALEVMALDGRQLTHTRAYDRDVARAAVAQNVSALAFVSREHREDKDFMLPIVRRDGRALAYAAALSDDPEVAKAAVAQKAEYFKYVSQRLRKDPDFMRSVLPGSMRLLKMSPLRADKDFVLQLLPSCGLALRFASDALRRDRQVVLCAVASCGCSLRWASDDLRADEEVVRRAAAAHAQSRRFAAPALQPWSGRKRPIAAGKEKSLRPRLDA